MDQNNKLGPLSANILSQSTIQGTDTTSAPLMPAGSIIMWSTGTAPDGWLLCDGSEISRTTYAALFALIGTTYGTPSSGTVFKLPDAQDRVVSGQGANNAVASSSGRLRFNHQIVSDSTASAITSGTVEVSVGAKDAGGQSVINSITATGHTHTTTLPILTLQYIIKT